MDVLHQPKTIGYLSLQIQSNMDALLGSWDDLIFLLSLEIWQFRDGITNDLQRLLDLLFTNDQRWCEPNNVLVRWFGLGMVSLC